MKHAAGLRLRFWGKNVVDKASGQNLPVRKNMTITAVKWKVPIIATACEFEMAVLKHSGLREGDVDSWKTCEGLLYHHGMLAKLEKKGYLLKIGVDQVQLDTLTELRQRYRTEPAMREALHADLFVAAQTETENGDVLAEFDPDVGEAA